MRSRVAVVAGLLIALGLGAGDARAAVVDGPTVVLDRSTVAVDDRVVLTIEGFDARIVTIAICGNDGLRGSADCNNELSKGVRLDGDGTSTIVQVGVAEPPMPCPCVVRVFSADNDEVATVPITITDHPTAATVSPPANVGLDESLGVVLAVDESDMSLGETVRYSLGGRGRFEVTASVKNRSNAILSGISVSGTVGRGGADQIAPIDFEVLQPLQPGQTWQQTVEVEVPAPSFGALQWRVDVARGGAAIVVEESTDHSPWLLLALAVVLVLDVALIALRLITARRARGRRHPDPGDDEPVEASPLDADALVGARSD